MSKHFCLRCGYAFDEPHLSVECPECESVTYLSRDDITPELTEWITSREVDGVRNGDPEKTDLSCVIGAILDLPDYEDREKATLAERDAEIAKLRACVKELEAAQAWHPASEAPEQEEDYVSLDKEVMTSQGFGIAHYNFVQKTWNFIYTTWHGGLSCEVIRWRELPPAPQEDGE